MRTTGTANIAAVLIAVAALAMAVATGCAPSAPSPSPLTSPSASTPLILADRIVVVAAGCPTFVVADPGSGVTVSVGPCGSVRLSPDGRSVLVGRRGALSVHDVATAVDRVLRSDADHVYEALGWSEGGRYVMWDLCSTADSTCDSEHVWIGEATEAPSEPDVSIERPEALVWSASDRRFAIGGTAEYSASGVWATGTGAGTDRRRFDGGVPVWSPDGTKLAFVPWVRFVPRTIDLVVAEADGANPRTLTTLDCCPRALFWSPDGSTIVARVEDSDGGLAARPAEFVWVGLDGTVLARAVAPDADTSPALTWSPAGDRFLLDGGDASVVPIDGRPPIELGDDVAAAWSPDGTQLVVLGRNGGPLRIVSAAEGMLVRTLERPIQGFASDIRWLR